MSLNTGEAQKKFDEEWGFFRQYIKKHPLTGFWGGVVIGALTTTAVATVGPIVGAAVGVGLLAGAIAVAKLIPG